MKERILFSGLVALGSAIGIVLAFKIILARSLEIAVLSGIVCFVVTLSLCYFLLYPKFHRGKP